MISLNVQIKLIIFSLIYGFLFSIILDVIHPILSVQKKIVRIIISFILLESNNNIGIIISFLMVLLMAVIYFVAIDKIGYIIFHIYSIFAIIIGFVFYDIMITVIAKKNKKW